MDLKLLKRNNIYSGKVFATIVDEVEYPSGRKAIREVAQHPGGAVILGAFPDRQVLAIRQFRYPFGETIWELPAGKLERDEDPLHCARREFEEETGYFAAEWKKITTIYTSPGFCTERLHLFLATGLSLLPAGRHLEEGEQSITLHKVPLDVLHDMIYRGEIIDAKSICAVILGARLIDHPQK